MDRLIVMLALLLASSGAAQAPGYVPPAGAKVPKVGDKAPEFALPDATGKTFKLSELLRTPATAKAGQESGSSWVLLIFYRGYW